MRYPATYVHVTWRHVLPHEPVEMLYEVSTDGRVLRQVELFRDGRAISDTLEWHKRRHPTFVGSSLHGQAFDFEDIKPPEFVAHRIDANAFDAAFSAAALDTSNLPWSNS